jgi:hypothetical protein
VGIYGAPELVSFEYGGRAVIIDTIPDMSYPEGFDPNNPNCEQYNTTIWERMLYVWWMCTNWFLYPTMVAVPRLEPLLKLLIYDPQTGKLPPNIWFCCFCMADAIVVIIFAACVAVLFVVCYLDLYVAVAIADRAASHDKAIGDASLALVSHKSTYERKMRSEKRKRRKIEDEVEKLHSRLERVEGNNGGVGAGDVHQEQMANVAVRRKWAPPPQREQPMSVTAVYG